MAKTSELINRFSAAAQRYEVTLKRVEAMRASRGVEDSRGRCNFGATRKRHLVEIRPRSA